MSTSSQPCPISSETSTRPSNAYPMQRHSQPNAQRGGKIPCECASCPTPLHGPCVCATGTPSMPKGTSNAYLMQRHSHNSMHNVGGKSHGNVQAAQRPSMGYACVLPAPHPCQEAQEIWRVKRQWGIKHRGEGHGGVESQRMGSQGHETCFPTSHTSQHMPTTCHTAPTLPMYCPPRESWRPLLIVYTKHLGFWQEETS